MSELNCKNFWYAYLAAHWRGQQGFLWSFWVNLVGLRVVIFLIQKQFFPGAGHDYSVYGDELLILTVLLHGVLLVWQVGGVLRAGERFILSGGSIVNVWGSYLGVLIAFWMSLSYGFDMWQWTLPYPGKNWQVEASDGYEIRIDKSGKVAFISGDVEPGITARFKLFLAQHSKVKTVVLHSDGGNIYEARGVSKLIRDQGLSTRVDGICQSACTTIFIGGKVRSLAKSAKLGFHQYRMNAKYQVGFSNIELEQTRDRSLFLSAGVKSGFVDKMFAFDANEMWFPNREQLRRAGVITMMKKMNYSGDYLRLFSIRRSMAMLLISAKT